MYIRRGIVVFGLNGVKRKRKNEARTETRMEHKRKWGREIRMPKINYVLCNSAILYKLYCTVFNM